VIRLKFSTVTLLALLSLSVAPVLRAQENTPSTASSSVASGQSSTPEAATEKSDPTEELKKPSPSVIKIGGMMGMKPAMSVTVFNWLNFLVLAIAVGYALLKALPKVFRGRTENIQKNIVEARIATEEARARLSAVEARLGKLDGELASLRSDNDRSAAEEEQRMQAQGEEEKARILQAAEQEIAAASAAAQRSLRAYAAEIAVDRAAAHLQITPEDDRVLIENFAGKLGAEGSRN
jgi:F-type H+-transporting ATPase subunit b